MSKLATIDGDSVANDINNAGQIVGSVTQADGTSTAVWFTR